MAGNRFKLVPLEQKSANEQLWDAARQAAGWLFAHRMKRLNIRPEQFNELFEQVVMDGVVSFMWLKIRCHKYNRDYDFFSNVFSAVWGTLHTTVTRYLKNMTRNAFSSLEHLEAESGVPIKANIKDSPDNRLFYKADYKYMPTDLKGKKAYGRWTHYQEEYACHLLECDYLGVTAMPFRKWFNEYKIGDKEDKIIDLWLDSDRSKDLKAFAYNYKRKHYAEYFPDDKC